MTEKSAVEKAAKVWRLLDHAAKRLPEGPAKRDAVKAMQNALRTLGKAQDAADALEKWSQRPEHKKET